MNELVIGKKVDREQTIDGGMMFKSDQYNEVYIISKHKDEITIRSITTGNVYCYIEKEESRVCEIENENSMTYLGDVRITIEQI